jgi:hypothetical protein
MLQKNLEITAAGWSYMYCVVKKVMQVTAVSIEIVVSF